MVGLQLSYGAQISIRRLVITPRLIANQPRLQEVTSPDQEQVGDITLKTSTCHF